MPPAHDAALSTALEAVDAVQADPDRARSLAEAVLQRNDVSPEASVTARWAVGLVARQLSDLDTAREHLSGAVALARSEGLARREGQIRSSLSLVLLYQGDTEGALTEADRAGELLAGVDAARNDMQRALILQRLGDLDVALELYRSALRGFRKAGDRIAEARLLANRGVLHGFRGEIEAGVSDLERAAEIARDLGQDLIHAGSAHNLGFLEGRRGDVPAALSWFDVAGQAYERLGRPGGMVERLAANRAELLLAAGLVDEADRSLRAVVAQAETLGNQTDLAETYLVAADTALHAGDPDASLEFAGLARRAFLEQDRPRWALLAEYAAARVGADRSDRGQTTERLRDLSTRLVDAGFVTESRHTLIIAGAEKLEGGDVAGAGALLEAAAAAVRRGSAVERSQAWYAAAMLRLARGNRRGAWRAVAAGLRVLRDHRATFGASELRAHSAGHSLGLVQLALDLALEAGDPRRLFMVVETWRGFAARLPPVRPDDDAEVQRALQDLRAAHASERERLLAGENPDESRRMVARAESRVRDLMRMRPGAQTELAAIDPTTIEAHLGDATLVTYFRHRHRLHALTVSSEGVRSCQMGDPDGIAREVGSIVFSLHRMAAGRGSEASLNAAETALDVAAGALSAEIIEPLGLSDGPVVIVPTGALHRLPWLALPGLAGREVSVVPSAGTWMAARAVRANGARTAALIAGPDLPGACREVEQLSRSYPVSRSLVGEEATTDRVLGAIEGASIAHLAAHGTFRSDNPLFSSLRMADGPLTVYDLERLSSPPGLVVMPSCDTAVSEVVHGDELLGLSSALLGLGSSGLIAPVVPVPDDSTIGLMLALHHNLRSGARPAAALSAAIAVTPEDDVRQRAVRRAFVAMGA